MAEKTLDTLFHDTLKDIYYARAEHPEGPPKMQRGAKSSGAKAGLREPQG